MSVVSWPRARIRRRAGAYTLTEMLVVLVIVGLLAAIVGPRLFNRLDDARRRTAQLQLTSLQTSIDLFRIDVGRLPTVEEGLDVLVTAPQGEPNWLGPYLARATIPNDPWGHAYLYAQDAEGFRVLSYGADGREGGDGAAGDIFATIQGEGGAQRPVQTESQTEVAVDTGVGGVHP